MRSTLAWMVIVAASSATGCSSCQKDQAPPPPSLPPLPPSSAAPGVTVNVAPGGASSALAPADTLVKAFPKDGMGGFTRVMAGTKPGYAEAKLQKDGKEVAIISIADAQRLVYTIAKFDGATEKIGDMPVLKTNEKESTALLKGRFQLKVFSTTLDHEARKAILASFDATGLGS